MEWHGCISRIRRSTLCDQLVYNTRRRTFLLGAPFLLPLLIVSSAAESLLGLVSDIVASFEVLSTRGTCGVAEEFPLSLRDFAGVAAATVSPGELAAGCDVIGRIDDDDDE